MDIDKQLSEFDILEYQVIDSADIPFSDEAVKACQANHCGKYGSCWTCPPGVGAPEELKKKVKSYEKAVVFTCKYVLEDSFDLDSMTAGRRNTERILRKIVKRLQETNQDVLALGCGSCELCAKCTYPDAPCRFPTETIASIESYGIDVVQLAKVSGVRYYNGTNTVTYFCIILLR